MAETKYLYAIAKAWVTCAWGVANRKELKQIMKDHGITWDGEIWCGEHIAVGDVEYVVNTQIGEEE